MQILLAILVFVITCAAGQCLPTFGARFFRQKWPFDIRVIFFVLCAVLIGVSILRLLVLMKSPATLSKPIALAVWIGLGVGAVVVLLYGIPSRWAFLLR